MAAEMPGSARLRARARLFWLIGALAVISLVYLCLPKSWFEIPDSGKAPGTGTGASATAPAGPATLEALHAAAANSPLDFTARSRYGMALAAAGRGPEALQEFRAAARLAPESPVVHHNLGIYHLNTGQPLRADAEFCRELEIMPGDGRAHYFRGLAFQARHQDAQAVAQFRLAIALAPELPDAYLSLAEHLAEKQPTEQTRALIDNYVRLGGDKTVAHFVLSRAYRARHEYKEAARYAEMSVQDNPNSYAYWRNLGDIYSYARRFEEADRALRRALTLARDPTNVCIELGMNAEKAGRFADAVDFFKKALAASPRMGNIHLYLARAYERLGDLSSARREEGAFRAWERETEVNATSPRQPAASRPEAGEPSR